jgi:uncharacterized cupin superfamily protein
MRKANLSDVAEEKWSSPSEKFCVYDKPLNEALGGDPLSADLMKRWPFAVELTRIPPGAANYPFHSHAAQFEFYLIVSGTATVRHKAGETEAKPGDFFVFIPGEPHQIINRSAHDLTYYSVADNPLNDHCYYPDSKKWSIKVPERQYLKGERVDYHHGEDEAK